MVNDHEFVPNRLAGAPAEISLAHDRENNAADEKIKTKRVDQQVSQLIRMNQRFNDNKFVKRAKERGHEEMDEHAKPENLAGSQLTPPKCFYIDQKRNVTGRLFSQLRNNTGDGGNNPGGKRKKDGGNNLHNI